MEASGAIKAIVLDANAFGASVEPNVATIENWASACDRHDAELWIPEIVAWELSQRVMHLSSQMAEAVAAHNAKRRRWGFPLLEVPAPPTEYQVISQMEKAGAIIIPLTENAAKEAIRDQVLLQGPATRKKDVKTGAADSGWIRSVIENNDDRTEDLILVTGDRQAVEKTCAALGTDVPRIAPHLGEIRHLLDESALATPEQAGEFQKLVQQYFAGPDFSGSDLIDLLGLGLRDWWDVDLHLDPRDQWESQDRRVVPGDIEITGDVERDNWSNSMSAPVRIAVEVQEQYARQDRWGDSPEYRQFSYDAWVDGRLSIFADAVRGVGVLEQYSLGANRDSVTSEQL